MPEHYLKLLPKYDGEQDISAQEHMDKFLNFTDDLLIEDDDVYMIFFVQTLEGEPRKWFINFPTNYVDSWNALNTTFKRQWIGKRDNLYYLTDFSTLKKNNAETTKKFDRIFNKMSNRIPNDINPTHNVTKVTFVGDLEYDFATMLRERSTQLHLLSCRMLP